ncbi:hypothetical protein [Dyadobacter sandarakinus]|uniref:Glycine zipper family protein n=1 Tax=Dyadobacter sandarakinus TaxID=2747268 RepID=A0ABX7I9R5_9BACT|nr:hypothetical protein [Dyadobacter sandarakinus]QRR02854.1 hypothetical protein HWI92_19025 [Dyadobacter sandarakinus]
MNQKLLSSTIVFIFVMLLGALTTQAQNARKPDVINLRNNTKLEVFIHEVDDSAVKYKKLTDPEGPLFTVRKNEIASIQYGNGEVETFEASLEVQNYYTPSQSGAPVQARPAAPAPRNDFEAGLQNANNDRLRSTYRFYKGKSKGGMAMGIAGIATGMLVAGIGTGIVAGATDANGNFATYQDEKRAIKGAWMMIGGFAGAVTFGTVGFVKAGKNGSKATRVKRELMRRGESLTFRLQPAFNPANGSGSLALSLTF